MCFPEAQTLGSLRMTSGREEVGSNFDVEFRTVSFEIWVLRIFAVATLVVGAVASEWMHNPHLLNRIGAILVVASLVATFWQFSFEGKATAGTTSALRKIRQAALSRELSLAVTEEAIAKKSAEIVRYVEKARRGVLLNSLTVAAVGEVFHGFGDLIFEVGSNAVRILL